jgi:hypothetical protein
MTNAAKYAELARGHSALVEQYQNAMRAAYNTGNAGKRAKLLAKAHELGKQEACARAEYERWYPLAHGNPEGMARFSADETD